MGKPLMKNWVAPDGTEYEVCDLVARENIHNLVMGVAKMTEDGKVVINVPEGTEIKTGTTICYRDPAVIENAFAEIASNYATINGKSYRFATADNRTFDVNDVKELHKKNDTIIIRIDETIGDPLFAQVIATVSKEREVPNAILYDREQDLSNDEKDQARENIGAASASEIDSLKKPVLTELKYDTTSNVVIRGADGSFGNASDITYCVAKASVEPLRNYTVSGSTKYGFAYWAFYDAQDVFISASEIAKQAIGAIENTEVVAPENAKYIRVSYKTDNVIAKIQTISMELVLDQKAILYDQKQKLSDAEKARARDNMDAASANAVRAIQSANKETSDAALTEKTYETTSNKVISASNGNLLGAGDASWCVAKVAVVPKKKYIISGTAKYGFACWAFYDAQGALLSTGETATEAAAVFESIELTAPENASYILVSYNTAHTIAKIQTIEVNNPKTKWKNKKWVCIGDSLTDQNNETTTKRYFDYVYYDTGISVVNMGVSGSGYARRSEDDNAFYQRVENIDTTADVATIFGSFNDLSAGLPIGEATDTDTTTLGGCINTTIDVLQEKIPAIILGIVSPTPWETTKPTTSGDAYNYVELLREICELRSIPFLDLWRGSNLRPWDEDFRALAYSKDNGAGTHPDEVGHKIIAPKFKAFLESLIM